MENGTKLRILYLYQHLVQHTDAEHTLSTAELMKILKEDYSFKVSHNTISDDLAMLHDCGLHIEHYESTQNKYYYDGHVYELLELKVLVNAIASSKFIHHPEEKRRADYQTAYSDQFPECRKAPSAYLCCRAREV